MTDGQSKAPRRFTDLPEDTRKALAGLGDDDLKTLLWLIETFKSVHGWCRVNKFLVFGLILGTLAVIQFIDKIAALFPKGK